MTRKHYVAIANAVSFCADLRSDREREAIREVARSLADIFESENPRFSRQKFLDACLPNVEG